MRVHISDEVEAELQELEQNLRRLRIEYEQYFLGAMKREPQALLGKVQKSITKLLNEPPRNSRQKFRFNTLNSQFQIYRQMWGRTMREIEAGTYRRDRFRMKVRERIELDQASRPGGNPEPARKRSSVEQLHDALIRARRRTGESVDDLDSERLARTVRQQMDAIRAKHGKDAVVRFKVVVENDRAKIRASVSKS